jgi:hypothetical protein
MSLNLCDKTTDQTALTRFLHRDQREPLLTLFVGSSPTGRTRDAYYFYLWSILYPLVGEAGETDWMKNTHSCLQDLSRGTNCFKIASGEQLSHKVHV